MWNPFGGRSEEEDQGSAVRTAIREFTEELTVSADDLNELEPLCRVAIARDAGLYVEYFASQMSSDMDTLRLKRNRQDNKVEGEGLAWFTAEEIHHIVIAPEDRKALETFFGKRT